MLLWLPLFLCVFYFVCVCVLTCKCRSMCVEVRGHLEELVLSFHHMAWGLELKSSGLAVSFPKTLVLSAWGYCFRIKFIHSINIECYSLRDHLSEVVLKMSKKSFSSLLYLEFAKQISLHLVESFCFWVITLTRHTSEIPSLGCSPDCSLPFSRPPFRLLSLS